MKRYLIGFLKYTGYFFLGLVLLYLIGRPIQIWVDGFYTGERGPYLQMMTADAVTIRWQTREAMTGRVDYGLSPTTLTNSIEEQQPAEVHELRLAGLKPATRYYYRVNSEKVQSGDINEYWFTTAALNSNKQPVRIWITGDQGYPGKVQDDVRDAMLTWAKQNPLQVTAERKKYLPDLWMTTGDNAYRSGTNQQFQDGFFEPYKKLLRNIPVIPIYGNHDSRRWVFFDIFTFPQQAEQGGQASGTEKYYSFNYQDIHFVVLDSESSSLDKDSEMLRWLEADLASATQQWLLVFFHHPPYTKGSHDSDDSGDSGGRMIEVRENLVPVLEKYGADVVFSGHTHMYERSNLMACHYGYSGSFDKSKSIQPMNNSYTKQAEKISPNSGTIYTIVGSSSKVDQGPLNHPAMPYAYQEAGSMVIDIDANKLTASFINDKNQVRDQFSLVKGVEQGTTKIRCE